MKKPEILSPAGNLEKLKFAFEYGADAVYASGRNFGLRSYAGNFSEDELKKAVQISRAKRKKIYITVNIFPHNDDIEKIKDYIYFLKELKVNGLIISDLGVFSVVKKTAPDIPVHVSVQANNVNYKEVEMWGRLGAERIILARELSFGEIREIREKVKGVALEIFVHGSMCMALSGRCLLSDYLTGRDANKGECAQSCRWSYSLVEEKRQGEYLSVNEDSRGTYIMNSKDLCMVKHLHKFAEIGIDSFKIEGRMKSVHYVAVTAGIYRRVLDEYFKSPSGYKFNSRLYTELEKIPHREYSTGFYFNDGKLKQDFKGSGCTSEYRYLGYIKETGRKGLIKAEIKNTFKTGEKIEVLTPGGNVFNVTVEGILNSGKGEELYTKQGNTYYLKLKAGRKISPYSIIRAHRP